ncbi:hypothetical protein PISL3812_09256 [Talaromyces islandicus]|uniref:Uncharacterized protein n=1 Tax=Talaromyces islandicus TaxID=28573 RepID=A0A0U1MB41_TALIS|nr:hypothetical protein PISL3812_09256 [Talaromyces islandicus]
MAEASSKKSQANKGNRNAAPPNNPPAIHELFANGEDLQNCSWPQLMEMFSSALREHEQLDHDLQGQAADLLKVFVTWSEVTISRDEDRSYKRFQTRMQYVQNAEQELAEKKKHYANVNAGLGRFLRLATTSISQHLNVMSRDTDERLLQRLNALKPSTVRLQREKKPLDFDTQSPGVGSLYGSFEGSSGAAIEEGIAAETLFDGDAIDDLIASLDQPHDLTLQPSNVDTGDQVQSLLTDANEFVKRADDLGSTADTLQHGTKSQKDDSIKAPSHTDDNSSSDEEEDEAEAERYLESVLREVNGKNVCIQQFEDLPGQQSEPHSHDRDHNKDENVADELSQGLAALSLPSVPEDLPGTKKERAEEEFQTEFCCVCYDTATTKCLDCEGNQFFCVRCWKEMHLGEEAIWADRIHNSVKYEPPSKR